MLLAITGFVVLSCSETSNPLQAPAMGVSDVSVPAKAEQIKTQYSDILPHRTFNECTGEYVSGSVEYKMHIFITLDPHGGYHGRANVVYQGWAIGETTGTEYLGRQTDPESYQLNSSGAFTHTFSHHVTFISKGGADNYLSHFLLRITITPDGTVRNEFEDFIYDGCGG